MIIIKEKTFDIPLADIIKLLMLFEGEIFKFLPNWTGVNTTTIRRYKFTNKLLKVLTKEDLEKVFTSKDLRDALSSCNLQIMLGFFDSSSFTSNNTLKFDKSKDAYLIYLNLNKNMLIDIQSVCEEQDLNGIVGISVIMKLLGMRKDKFESILSKTKLLDSLVHELSHWLDDLNHNNFIFKKIQKSSIKGSDISDMYHTRDINASYLEINAQVHAIKNLKQVYWKQWNNLTFFEMLSKDFSLVGVYRKLKDTDGKLAVDWLESLQKRLAREDLLGKKMLNIPESDKLLSLESWILYESIESDPYCDIKKYL